MTVRFSSEILRFSTCLETWASKSPSTYW